MGQTTVKKRDAARTRAEILDAAKRLFGEHGFDGASTRMIAAAAGVDAALVNRYFTSKEGLFLEASDLRLRLPELRNVAPQEVADLVIPRFVEVWEEEGAFLPLLRSSGTNPVALEALQEVFAGQVMPAVSARDPEDARRRSAALATVVIGLAFTRYVLRLPGIADAGVPELVELARPLLAAALGGEDRDA